MAFIKSLWFLVGSSHWVYYFLSKWYLSRDIPGRWESSSESSLSLLLSCCKRFQLKYLTPTIVSVTSPKVTVLWTPMLFIFCLSQSNREHELFSSSHLSSTSSNCFDRRPLFPHSPFDNLNPWLSYPYNDPRHCPFNLKKLPGPVPLVIEDNIDIWTRLNSCFPARQ